MKISSVDGSPDDHRMIARSLDWEDSHQRRNIGLIAAVGRSGQIGLDGKLPWHDPEDLRWFRQMTMGGFVVMGGVTYREIASKLDGRVCIGWGRDVDPESLLRTLYSMDPNRNVWIAGGRRTYQTFMPFVRRSFVTHVNYDGPADTVMPALWHERYTFDTQSNISEIAETHA